jgi:hypothetical protein
VIAQKGNLAPDGAILRCAEASSAPIETQARACLRKFEDLANRFKDPDPDIRAAGINTIRSCHSASITSFIVFPEVFRVWFPLNYGFSIYSSTKATCHCGSAAFQQSV